MSQTLMSRRQRAGRALPVAYHGLLYQPTRYPDVKDPSLAFDGSRWHLFGTGCGLPTGPEILHCTARTLGGPWTEEPTPLLHGVGYIRHAMAPGVVADGRRLHLFLQHEFNKLGGHIEHLVSDDGGLSFMRGRTAVRSRPGSDEAGVYDAAVAEVDGERYMVYAGMSVVGQPDLYVARSSTGSWNGPWDRLGCILDHRRVPCHNQIGDADYEWGLEGPQLLHVPAGAGTGAKGTVLLTAVCFLPGRPVGDRQRLLIAVGERATGPYVVVGAPVEPSGPSGSGENGHATAALDRGLIHLVYQERAGDGLPWRIRRATVQPEALIENVAALDPGDAPSGGGTVTKLKDLRVAGVSRSARG